MSRVTLVTLVTWTYENPKLNLRLGFRSQKAAHRWLEDTGVIRGYQIIVRGSIIHFGVANLTPADTLDTRPLSAPQ